MVLIAWGASFVSAVTGCDAVAGIAHWSLFSRALPMGASSAIMMQVLLCDNRFSVDELLQRFSNVSRFFTCLGL